MSVLVYVCSALDVLSIVLIDINGNSFHASETSLGMLALG